MKPAIGILGGTFDPVHYGHLLPAQETMQKLALAQMRLMPNHIPPHRPQPIASAQQRLIMLQLAVSSMPGFTVDDRELRHHRPSYTIDTLIQMRLELAETPLCFLIGMDSLLSLPHWHRWRELTDYAHLIVSVRPGWTAPRQGELADFILQHQIDDPADLHRHIQGGLYWMQNTPVDLSATQLRADLAAGRAVAGRIPAATADYLQQQRIYCRSVI